ncbi:MAG TPA: ArgE/DapE family deacylase [Acidobacteriota bacterium]|nr:ArgE/DapE family deacylase [Acidobacteriota bacterium]
MNDFTIKLLRDLVAIDSVNPSLVPGGAGEKQIGDAIAKVLRKCDLDVEVIEAAPGRPNVIGILRGQRPGPTLMYCGHTDTVGVEGMSRPFDPVIKEGRLYGRGSQDMKGGLAAIIGAARELSHSHADLLGTLLIAAVADEEYASIGASALVQSWKADAAVVTEPSDLSIGIAHKGFSWLEVSTEGRAAHGSRPLEGRDAILRMGRVLAQLEHLSSELRSRNPHPLLGNASLHASLIAGGRELSTYPDRCSLKMERRLLPGETDSVALQEVQDILQKIGREDKEFQATVKLLFGQPAYETPSDHQLPAMLQSLTSKAGVKTQLSGMTFWTDAAILGGAGIPSLVFGPGGAGLHGVEEYVRMDEVLLCKDILVQLARQYLG